MTIFNVRGIDQSVQVGFCDKQLQRNGTCYLLSWLPNNVYVCMYVCMCEREREGGGGC